MMLRRQAATTANSNETGLLCITEHAVASQVKSVMSVSDSETEGHSTTRHYSKIRYFQNLKLHYNFDCSDCAVYSEGAQAWNESGL